MESDDDDDVVHIPINENGEEERDWWEKEMLKRPDKFCHIKFDLNGGIRYLFIPRVDVIDDMPPITDVPPLNAENQDKSNEMEKKEIVEIEKPKNIHQMNNGDRSNETEKKETPVTEKPKNAVSLAKSIGKKWRSFKKNVMFTGNKMADKSEDAKMSPHEPLDPVTFLKSTEVSQWIESIVQVAVDKSVKEMKEKIHEHSSIIKKLEKDLEEQQELVKKLEESEKREPHIQNMDPSSSLSQKFQKDLEEQKELVKAQSLKCKPSIPKDPVELEEAELKKIRRSLVVIGVPETYSDSDHEKNLADIESIGRILKELEIETTPVSVYRMGEQKEDGKPRMLKVVMPSAQARRQVLRQARNSKVYNDWGDVKITTSLSTE